MRSANETKHEEAADASWEASRGAIAGAAKWGLAMAVLGGIGYAVSPVYRGLTIQFKVYVYFYLLNPYFPLVPFLLYTRLVSSSFFFSCSFRPLFPSLFSWPLSL
jgi:hypothetical protein